MDLTTKQRGVAQGMAAGALASLAVLALAIILNPLGFPEHVALQARASLAASVSLVPIVFVFASIARLAKHRFFTPEDIDGGGLSPGTARAKVLQALLQNTLEQTVLAVGLYAAWAVLAPGTWLSALPLLAGCFALGRALFFSGYEGGAPRRALGFALTFYPTVMALVCLLADLGWSAL